MGAQLQFSTPPGTGVEEFKGEIQAQHGTNPSEEGKDDLGGSECPIPSGMQATSE